MHISMWVKRLATTILTTYNQRSTILLVLLLNTTQETSNIVLYIPGASVIFTVQHLASQSAREEREKFQAPNFLEIEFKASTHAVCGCELKEGLKYLRSILILFKSMCSSVKHGRASAFSTYSRSKLIKVHLLDVH